jgi:UDP-glucose 4-epimerase
MKALVTGGAGFIGSHLAEALVRRGVEVVVLDNFSLGSQANLAWVRSGDALTVETGEVGDLPLLERLLAGVDWVFHQAARPSVPRSVADPLGSHAVNLDATLNLLMAARAARVARFVFASSSSIYGDSEAPLKHEGLPPQPLSPYGLQKYAAERYGQLFHRHYGLPVVSLRYFNVFGPRQAFDSPYAGVIARFCTQFLRGEAPVIFGDGRQSRDFTFVENVVAANLRAVEVPTERVAGRVFNVAGGDRLDLLRLVEELNRLTSQNLVPRFEPVRPGDIQSSCADVTAARTGLGWVPGIGWAEGLARTLAWYRDATRGGGGRA